jgi:SAM-dependent methyltransferase
LRVPHRLQLLLGGGLFSGLIGLVVLLATPGAPRVYGALLLLVGAASAALSAGLWMITSPRLRERARRRMLDAVEWHGGEQVLDVGCGNGFLLIEIAKQLTTGRAIGIDLWKPEAGTQSSEIAWRNAQLEGLANRIDIRNIDARAMPFDDRSFDVIASSLMLHHAGGSADRDQVVREMLRVLKPGGSVLLYDASPLIAAAERPLRESGFTSIRHSGRIMALLIAGEYAGTGVS